MDRVAAIRALVERHAKRDGCSDHAIRAGQFYAHGKYKAGASGFRAIREGHRFAVDLHDRIQAEIVALIDEAENAVMDDLIMQKLTCYNHKVRRNGR